MLPVTRRRYSATRMTIILFIQAGVQLWFKCCSQRKYLLTSMIQLFSKSYISWFDPFENFSFSHFPLQVRTCAAETAQTPLASPLWSDSLQSSDTYKFKWPIRKISIVGAGAGVRRIANRTQSYYLFRPSVGSSHVQVGSSRL